MKTKRKTNRFGVLRAGKYKAIKFYEEHPDSDLVDFKAVFDHFEPVNVLGDGNCGPYVFLLAKMNRPGIESRTLLSRLKNNIWFHKIVTDYRKELKKVLTDNIIQANAGQEYFNSLGFEVREILDGDLEAIYSDEVENYYPDGTLDDDYQFP